MFAPLVALWNIGSAEAYETIADNMLTLEGTREHIVIGTPDKDLYPIEPQAWTFPY